MQHFLFLHPQRWLGVSHPINTADDYVIKPLETIPNDPALRRALAEYKAAPEKQKKEWSEAYAKPLEEYATAVEEKKTPAERRCRSTTSTGTVTVQASGAGPVPTMMTSLLSLAQSGGLDGSLLTSNQFFQTDYTKPLLFMADGGLLDERAEAAAPARQAVGPDERDRQLPGPALAVAVRALVPGRTDEDITERGHPGAAHHGRAEPRVHLHPLHPRSSTGCPRWIPIYKLIWREHYRAQ